MMSLSRLATVATAFALLPVASLAQVGTCDDGVVQHEGDSYACSGVDLLSRVSLSAMNAESGNDVWGWTDPMTGSEYALMGLDNGTYFVDVTQPKTPVLLGKLPTATSPSLWRDMKVFADHAFVVSEAPGHGLQVFDLRRLRGLKANPERVFEADAVFTGPAGNTLGRAHNVAINEDSGRAYVVGARDLWGSYACAGGLYIVDISDPVNPAFLGCFSADGYTHDVQCVIYDGPHLQHYGKELCFASNENTVTIVDVTDPAAPIMLSQAIYPYTAYTHQGWLSEDKKHFFVNDELDEQQHGLNTRTIILDVSNLNMPQYVGSYHYPTIAITHNLFIRGDKLFAANYTTGLRILNIGGMGGGTGVTSIASAGYFDTHPPHSDRAFQGAWSNYPFFESGTVLVSDINRGLFMLRPIGFGVSTEPDSGALAVELAVFPNPVGERLNLEVNVSRDQHVQVELLDVLGRRVATVFEGTLTAGTLQRVDHAMTDLADGLYVVRVRGEHFTESRRVTLAR